MWRRAFPEGLGLYPQALPVTEESKKIPQNGGTYLNQDNLVGLQKWMADCGVASRRKSEE